MGDKKRGLRIEAARRRESLPGAECRALGHLIQEAAINFSFYLTAQSVALYSPIGNEVSTEQIRDHALNNGKSVYYPGPFKTRYPELIRVRSPRDFRRGEYGILYPVGDEALKGESREGLLVFMPGLAFDVRGGRLGRGRGWYDRLLSRLSGAISVALAYEFQIVDELPVDALDHRVQFIITETRTVNCSAPDGPSHGLFGDNIK